MCIRAYMIDDEPDANELLTLHLRRFDEIDICGSFTDTSTLLQALSSEPVDVVFLDIQMPDVSGLNFIDDIRSLTPHIMIVFVTAHEEHALKAFELNVQDYLTKPISYTRLQKTINKLKEHHSHYTQANKLPQVRLFERLGFIDHTQNEHLPKFKTRKAVELIALLLINNHHAIHKNTLYDTLWPNNCGEGIRFLLNSNVYNANRVMKTLNPPLEIIRYGDMYRFPTSITTDLQKLLQAYEQKTNAINVEQIELALSLYRGHLLQAESYPWLVGIRQRYFNMYKVLTCRLSNIYVESQPDKAVKLLLDSLGKYALSVSLNKALLKVYAFLNETALFNEHLEFIKHLYGKTHSCINWDTEMKKILKAPLYHEKA